MVERYKFVGSGVTNSQGVAQLTHDANGNPLATPGYVGSGKGLTQMCASLDSPTVMSSGSDQSGTYGVLDCGFYDIGTDTTHKTITTSQTGTGSWYNPSGALTVSYSSNGTTITNPDGTSRHFFYHDTAITSVKVGVYNSILNNSAVEFEITSITSQIDVYLTDGTNNKSVPITSIGEYKIVLDGSIVHLYKDGTEQTLTGTNTMNGTNVRVSFLTNATNESLTFRNFKVYPI